MKATEFVKKYGIGKAVGILHEWSMFTQIEKPTHFDSDLDIFIHKNDFKFLDESDVCLIELKNLVNAYELVESLNGLIGAKASVREVFDDYPHDYMKRKLYGFDVKCCVVMKAIELVESVNG